MPRAEAGARRARVLVMGVVNLTPDSFYASSRARGIEEALARARALEEEGADVLDFGGASSRPGSRLPDEEEELGRVLPALEAVAKRARVPLSIDTCRAGVAERALACGATWLNDITALRGDPRMPQAALGYERVVLMHMKGEPRSMQDAPAYGDVVSEIAEFLRERVEAFRGAGGDPGRLWLDPGIGFGKTLEHNLDILRRLEALSALGRPLLLGLSRKSFIGRLLDPENPPGPESRLEGSLAAACRAVQKGAAGLRVHDVGATRRALSVWRELL